MTRQQRRIAEGRGWTRGEHSTKLYLVSYLPAQREEGVFVGVLCFIAARIIPNRGCRKAQCIVRRVSALTPSRYTCCAKMEYIALHLRSRQHNLQAQHIHWQSTRLIRHGIIQRHLFAPRFLLFPEPDLRFLASPQGGSHAICALVSFAVHLTRQH